MSEGAREGGREGGRESGRERGREGGREGETDGEREKDELCSPPVLETSGILAAQRRGGVVEGTPVCPCHAPDY